MQATQHTTLMQKTRIHIQPHTLHHSYIYYLQMYERHTQSKGEDRSTALARSVVAIYCISITLTHIQSKSIHTVHIHVDRLYEVRRVVPFYLSSVIVHGRLKINFIYDCHSGIWNYAWKTINRFTATVALMRYRKIAVPAQTPPFKGTSLFSVVFSPWSYM